MTLRAIAKQETLKRDMEIIRLLTRRKDRKSAKEVAQLYKLEDKTVYNILYKRRTLPKKAHK
jgi:hypothetical protein